MEFNEEHYIKQLADTEKLLAEKSEETARLYKLMEGLQEDLAYAREDRKETRDVVKELTLKLEKATTGITCTDFSIAVMFAELSKYYSIYLEKVLPEDMKKYLLQQGFELTPVSYVGRDRFSKYFQEGYVEYLMSHYEFDTRGLDDAEKGGIWEIYEKTLDQLLAVCEKTLDTTERENAVGFIEFEEKRLTAEVNAYEMAGKKIPDALLTERNIMRAYEARLNSTRSRFYAFYGSCGTFLAYLYSSGMSIQDVDVGTYKAYRKSMWAIRDIKTTTANNHTAENRFFFNYLIDTDNNLEKCKYMAPFGTLDPLKKPVTEKRKAIEALKTTVTISAGKVNVVGEASTIYTTLREKKVSTNHFLHHDPRLIELCLRISRETGLRYKFLSVLTWGQFSIDPVDTVDRKPVFELELTEEMLDRVIGVKKVPIHHLQISGTLGKMIKKYRGDHPELLDSFYVFNNVRLRGLKKTPKNYATTIRNEIWNRYFMDPLEKLVGIDTTIEPMTFRNSYYTIMLSALGRNYDFEAWTGDTRETAEDNYRAPPKTINIPAKWATNLTYAQIVTRIFGNE